VSKFSPPAPCGADAFLHPAMCAHGAELTRGPAPRHGGPSVVFFLAGRMSPGFWPGPVPSEARCYTLRIHDHAHPDDVNGVSRDPGSIRWMKDLSRYSTARKPRQPPTACARPRRLDGLRRGPRDGCRLVGRDDRCRSRHENTRTGAHRRFFFAGRGFTLEHHDGTANKGGHPGRFRSHTISSRRP
jgi:hypothetical protein